MPRKMPKQKPTSESSTTLSRREFMESLPDGISMADLIARAKRSGVKISRSYAYTLRAAGKTPPKPRRTSTPEKRKPKTIGNGAARATAPVSESPVATKPRGGDGETQFVSLAVDLGLRKSQELLDRLRARLQTLIH